MEEINIKFDIAELKVLNLQPDDVLTVKLIGDDIQDIHMRSLRENLSHIFPNNKVAIFAMPKDSDIVFEKIESDQTPVVNKGYCEDCNCGKKEETEKLQPTPISPELKKELLEIED